MYARTLVEGEVRPGDEIRVMPPEDPEAAARQILLERIDAVTLDCDVALWRTAADAGVSIDIEEHGELAMASSTELRSSAFNRALGHRMLPNLTHRMLAFYVKAGRPGWIVADRAPWPGAEAESRSIVFAADPASVADPTDPDVTFREIASGEADTWSRVLVEASSIDGPERRAWIEATRRQVGTGGHHHLIAEHAGEPIGVAGLFTRRRVGLLATTAVLPEARGRGIQRALVAARVRLAIERRCNVVTASALVDSPSARNLERMGFGPIHERALYRFDPAAHPVPPTMEP
jgi:GNAT superfamily N-acetyltransferase